MALASPPAISSDSKHFLLALPTDPQQRSSAIFFFLILNVDPPLFTKISLTVYYIRLFFPKLYIRDGGQFGPLNLGKGERGWSMTWRSLAQRRRNRNFVPAVTRVETSVREINRTDYMWFGDRSYGDNEDTRQGEEVYRLSWRQRGCAGERGRSDGEGRAEKRSGPSEGAQSWRQSGDALPSTLASVEDPLLPVKQATTSISKRTRVVIPETLGSS